MSVASAARSSRIGIDLGGTKIAGIVLNRSAEVADQIRIDTPRGDYAGTVRAIGELVRRLDPAGAMTVGVGTPGAWIDARQRMQNCNSTWLNDRPLLTDLVTVMGPRVRLANDADCFALSEATSGSAAGFTVVFGMILGTGVGGGLVVDGRLLRGPNGLAGEWGHTPISLDPGIPIQRLGPGRACYCGQMNCVETFLSGPGLLATHRTLFAEESAPPSTAREIYRRAALSGAGSDWPVMAEVALLGNEEGNEEGNNGLDDSGRARATLGVYCRLLACNLARMVNIVDPHAIVLGGGLSQMTEIYQPVRALMADHVFGEVFETELLPPRWGDASGVRGAAWLWD